MLKTGWGGVGEWGPLESCLSKGRESLAKIVEEP